jgi:hypothetical protein
MVHLEEPTYFLPYSRLRSPGNDENRKNQGIRVDCTWAFCSNFHRGQGV